MDSPINIQFHMEHPGSVPLDQSLTRLRTHVRAIMNIGDERGISIDRCRIKDDASGVEATWKLIPSKS